MSEILKVTEDLGVLRELRAKLEGDMDSRTLAEYAHTIGLYPLGYEEGQIHTICEYWPPGYEGEEGLLVWEVGLDSPVHDADEDDGWGEVFGEHEPPAG